MSVLWYYKQDDQRHGPVTDQELRELTRTGGLRPDAQVWRSGMKDWVSIDSVIAVDKSPIPPAPPRISETNPQARAAAISRPDRRPRQSNKSAALWAVAAVAVILVGAIGWVTISRSHSAATRKNHQHASRHVSLPQTQPIQIAPANDKHRESKTGYQPAPVTASQSKLRPTIRDTISPAESGDPPYVVNSTTSTPEVVLPTEPSPPVVPSNAKPKTVAQSESPTPAVQPVAAQEEKPAELFQEISVLRKPTFVVQGVTIAQEIQYQIHSKLQLGPVGSDGTREVSQVILDTRLEKSDPLSRAAFQSSLRDLIGQQFSFTLNARHEVIKFTGHKETRKTIEAEPAGLDGFLITSVMDEDGWKEMAQLSFFLPDESATNGQWKRQMTHDWGPLGSWFGETSFSRNRQSDQYNYSHNLSYLAPDEDGGGLPFTIKSAKFETQQAAGVIQLDAKLERVMLVQEKFQARGDIETQVLGQPSRVLVEEQQLLQIRLFDQNTWRQ